MRPLLIAILAILFMSGCKLSREDMARSTFEEAVEAYSGHKYNRAKILLDSVIYTYHDIKPIVRESKDMLEIIYKTEQERNMLFLDSLLAIREQEIKPLMAQFEEDSSTGGTPVLVHKRQVAMRAWDRSYLRAHVDKNGTFYISSHYTGNGYISHYAVKAMADNMYQTTDSMETEAYIHRFNDGENYFETIKFKNGTDNGVGSFIATNFDKPIDVLFIGPRTKYRIRLTETDKNAIRDTYQLALMLRETVQIKSQIRTVKMCLKKKHSED